MRVIEHRIVVPAKDTYKRWNLYACGDWHLGSINCAETLLDRTLKAVEKDPYGLFIGMGDYGECIVPGDPRFDARGIAPRFLPKLEDIAGAQFMEIKTKLAPLAKQGKIIGLLDGNHENNIRKRHFRHLTLDLCRELNVEYLSYSSFIRLKFSITNATGSRGSSKSYIISAAHGRGGGRKKGGQVNSMGDALAWANVDIFLRGHTHRLIADSITRLFVMGNPPTLAQETPVMGITGCYFRTYAEGTDSYGEEADYPPSDLGCIVVGLRPFKIASKEENEKRIRTGEVTISRFIP